MTIDEAIAKERELEESYIDMAKLCLSDNRFQKSDECVMFSEEHKQMADWLEELKVLRLLLDWAIECGFGLDSFPDEYEQYKHTLTDDMNYTEMVKKIAKCVVDNS